MLIDKTIRKSIIISIFAYFGWYNKSQNENKSYWTLNETAWKTAWVKLRACSVLCVAGGMRRDYYRGSQDSLAERAGLYRGEQTLHMGHGLALHWLRNGSWCWEFIEKQTCNALL